MSNRDLFKTSISSFLQVTPQKLEDETSLLTDLVHESFILIEMVIDLQEKHGIRLHQEDLAEVRTLGQLLDVLERKLDHK
jgi:acyl carrier protein